MALFKLQFISAKSSLVSLAPSRQDFTGSSGSCKRRNRSCPLTLQLICITMVQLHLIRRQVGLSAFLRSNKCVRGCR